MEGSAIQGKPTINHNCSFNPLDKVVELQERLVQTEKEKVEYLENYLEEKNPLLNDILHITKKKEHHG